MKYLKLASEIYEWLAGFQVQQKPIWAERKNSHIFFTLNHPVQRKIKVSIAVPENRYFRSNGIGMKIADIKNTKVKIECYDDGGIWDPVDGNITGTHYATTHFALLGAIIYQFNNDKQILERIKQAIQFHIRTSRDEYVFDSWMYHWDFQNYAFLETYRLLKDKLDENELLLWKKTIRRSRENTKNRLTNWVAMRAYVALLKYNLFNSHFERIKYYYRKKELNKSRLADGCYDDYLNSSRVIQYHIYTVALLHRMYLIANDENILRDFVQGIDYFIHFIDDDGCFNYLGRGQEQIFGYGAALYSLEAAKITNPQKAGIYQYYINRIWEHLSAYKAEDGYFPLVLNKRKIEEKYGWYDYHHLTVYNAFLGVWLGLTELLKPVDVREEKPSFKPVFVSKPSQVAFLKNENVFVSIFGGLEEYLTEPGLTFLHIRFKDVGWFFTCPGGPSPDLFGKKTSAENVERNVFTPIACDNQNRWYYPSRKRGRVEPIGEDGVKARINYGPFEIEREIVLLKNGIRVNDQFHFLKQTIYSEFRFLNIPVIVDKFYMEVQDSGTVLFSSDKGKVKLKIINTDFNPAEFERLETIKTAKGQARVLSMRNKLIETEIDSKKQFQFELYWEK